MKFKVLMFFDDCYSFRNMQNRKMFNAKNVVYCLYNTCVLLAGAFFTPRTFSEMSLPLL